ncbi:MAG: hypothetical protein M3022_12330 [Actinomycetota bacterium]|nr:hypothetical protein [Actinomycetota bacterium]
MILLTIVLAALPCAAVAEQASQAPGSPAAGLLDIGQYHSCAVVSSAAYCWGAGAGGELGYGNANNVGDVETPGSVGPIDFGPGLTVKAISAGDAHTCAILSNGSVRCWGFGGDGRLGYGNTNSVGDGVGADLSTATVGPIDFGSGPMGPHTAIAISAGGAHTCAILDDHSVRCWGFGLDGSLGYNNTNGVGDGVGADLTPATVGPIDFGSGPMGPHTVIAISAGYAHTCAILEDHSVRCWGFAAFGRLGYGNTSNVGDGVTPTGMPPDQTPATVGAVDLGGGHGAVAISAGGPFTCAILDNGNVRCWGYGGNGQLGYGNTSNLGDTATPGSVAPVDLGGHKATAISVAIPGSKGDGGQHTCAILDDGSVRCWGYGAFGQLGYGNGNSVGDGMGADLTPATAGPVDLGAGRTAIAISAGTLHTCALLDDSSVRCWGLGTYGRLGYCNTKTVGNSQTPGSVGPVALGTPGIAGQACPDAPPPPDGTGTVTTPATVTTTVPTKVVDPLIAALAAQSARAAALRTCLLDAARKDGADRRRTHSLPSSQRRKARRRDHKRAGQRRRACLRLHGRVPGRVTKITAMATGRRKLQLFFQAVGTDGSNPPAARAYLIKQSLTPIRTAGDFERAAPLCKSSCSYNITSIGAALTLIITDLHPRLYYYAIAARDNVTGTVGPRSETVKARPRQ